jgi:hypothetical protein
MSLMTWKADNHPTIGYFLKRKRQKEKNVSGSTSASQSTIHMNSIENLNSISISRQIANAVNPIFTLINDEWNHSGHLVETTNMICGLNKWSLLVVAANVFTEKIIIHHILCDGQRISHFSSISNILQSYNFVYECITAVQVTDRSRISNNDINDYFTINTYRKSNDFTSCNNSLQNR